MKRLPHWLVIAGLLAFMIVGCSHENDPVTPEMTGQYMSLARIGTETLGPPGIAIASGSGIVQTGVGLVTQPANMSINVPGTVKQALLYWAGGDPTEPYDGDDTIVVNGMNVTGTMIGGPTLFFGAYRFSAYRAVVTEMVNSDGVTNFEISGMDFDPSMTENNGVGLLVIYDDGTNAEISLVDGQDLAFWQFGAPLNATVPQTFTFAPATSERTAKLVVFSGSVDVNRPNEITVTIGGGVQSFVNQMASTEGPLWDALSLAVTVPAGADEMTVELISTPTTTPLGASMSWVAGALSVPVERLPASLGDYVWVDEDKDGIQDPGENGIGGVVVNLWTGCPPDEIFASTVTNASGWYMFTDLEPGDYNVQFELPNGYEFTMQDQGGDDAKDSDPDPTTGITDCITLDPGESDLTIDAGLFVPCATIGDYVWNDEDMDGIQDPGEMGIEGVIVHLMTCNGEELDETVTDADGMYLFECIPPGDYKIHFVKPIGYVWSPEDATSENLDSDADEAGFTDCTTLDPGETDTTWDAGMYMPPQIGCTHTIGYWKNHGYDPPGNQEDVVSQYLPIWLGDGTGKSLHVTTASMAKDILTQKVYGRPNNGITKLYAQLLAAKLSIADGASDSAVADAIMDIDEFLAMYDYTDWSSLDPADQHMVNDWKSMMDDYNNGIIGPGHCGDEHEMDGDGDHDWDK